MVTWRAWLRTVTSVKAHDTLHLKHPCTRWNFQQLLGNVLHADFAGPFLGQMFLIVVDAYSKWLEVVPMSSATTNTTIERLRNIFATHGLPRVLVTDNGAQFTSSEF